MVYNASVPRENTGARERRMAQRRRGLAFAGEPAPASGRQELHCWVFDPFRLDLRDERLWRGPDVLPLPPKTFAVLCCLVTQAGQLVTSNAFTSVRNAFHNSRRDSCSRQR